jgi:GNAT superfamily N-acetyltransferase
VTVSSIEVRVLSEADMHRAFGLVHQLRDHLDIEAFDRLTGRQRDFGYVMFGAFAGADLVGVIGMRIVSTLARGEHLHVDDLVVESSRRGDGIGRALMGFAEQWASEHGCQSIFLDSRPEVLNFYSRLGYQPHTATLVRKRVGLSMLN